MDAQATTIYKVENDTHARQDKSSQCAFASSSSKPPNRERQITEEYIHYVVSNLIPKAMSQKEIVQAM